MKRFSPATFISVISLVIAIGALGASLATLKFTSQPPTQKQEVQETNTFIVETVTVEITATRPTEGVTPYQSRTPRKPFYITEVTNPAKTEIPALLPAITPTTTVPPNQTPIPTTILQIDENCPPTKTFETGMVVKVTDGDTIKVNINGTILSVRYIGMDTPETAFEQEPFGQEAKAKNIELVEGKEVTLFRDYSEVDKFGRLLRYVFIGKTFVNREMVATGFAEAKDYPPDTACSKSLHAAQQTAQAEKIGMWSSPVASHPTIQATMYATTSPGTKLTIIEVNKKLEYVIIKNESTTSIDLAGWILRSELGNQDCVLGTVIQPGATLQVWSKTGPGFSCNIGSEIWNNSKSDPAVLIDPQGNEISRK